jgi:uncharacterized protein YjbJ (UPF0337 family)
MRDKSGGAAQYLKGRVKEAYGALTGRIDRRSQGQADQMKGAARNRRGHVKDVFK